jgi:hypothetical protein
LWWTGPLIPETSFCFCFLLSFFSLSLFFVCVQTTASLLVLPACAAKMVRTPSAPWGTRVGLRMAAARPRVPPPSVRLCPVPLH